MRICSGWQVSPRPMSRLLTTRDLKEVYRTTFKANKKWKNILLELDISRATIKNIGENCVGDPEDCYQEGLSKWLEGQGGERSWESLVKALSSPTVDHSDIAMVIERDYIQSGQGSAVSASTTAIERQTCKYNMLKTQVHSNSWLVQLQP